MNFKLFERALVCFALLLGVVVIARGVVTAEIQESVPSRDSVGHPGLWTNPTASTLTTIQNGWGQPGTHFVAVNPKTNRIYLSAQTDDLSKGAVLVVDGSTVRMIEKIPLQSDSLVDKVWVNAATNRIYIRALTAQVICVLDGNTSAFLGELPVSGVLDLAINPITNRLYVSTVSDITVFDGDTHANLGVITNSGGALAVNPHTNQVYAALGSIRVIDGGTNTLVGTIAPSFSVDVIAVNPETNRIYATSHSFGDCPIYVIDGGTNSFVAAIGDPGSLDTLVANPTTNQVYLNRYGVPLRILDGNTNTIGGNILQSEGDGIALNPANHQLLVAGTSLKVLSTLNNTIVNRTILRRGPTKVALASTSNQLYVLNRFEGGTVIDTQTHAVQETVAFGGKSEIAVQAVTGRVYSVSDSQVPGEPGKLFVFDPTTNMTTTINVLDGQTASYLNCVAVNSMTNRVYVGGNRLFVIDGALGTVVQSVPVGGTVTSIEVNAPTNRVYATVRPFTGGEANLVVLDGNNNTLVATIASGFFGRDLTVNPLTNRIYVPRRETAPGSRSFITIIDGVSNTITGTIPIIEEAADLELVRVEVNPLLNRFYVIGTDGTLRIYDGRTNSPISQVSVRLPAPAFYRFDEQVNGLTVNSTTNRVYVTDNAHDRIVVVDDTPPFEKGPQIFSFSPQSGPVGIQITITGSKLDTVTSLRFNGREALFQADSATQITATVPPGATTGPISISGAGGSATGPVFTVVRTK
ncbi:MAG: hypothetical protein K1Y36_16575 [Blastocatellia bacterium]|nr:hypothetical protein [Blastocatellia bacterium]